MSNLHIWELQGKQCQVNPVKLQIIGYKISKMCFTFWDTHDLPPAYNFTGDVEPSQTKCADFNNTTWQEYRQHTKLQVQYLLLTRKNADCASLFTQDCLNHTQKHTAYFNSSLPTKVIVHGYR